MDPDKLTTNGKPIYPVMDEEDARIRHCESDSIPDLDEEEEDTQ